MIRPFTCICLVLAAGSGLYLYQVKQRAFALDADLRSTFHQIDMAREKTRMLRADWALMNDPERLQALSTQYLTLKPMGPSQLVTLDQLAATLPPPIPPGTKIEPAAPDLTVPSTDPTHGVPMASTAPATPSGGDAGGTAVALLQPVATAPAADPTDTAASGTDASSVSSADPSPAVPPAAPSHPTVAPLPKVAAAVIAPRVAHHATKRIQTAVAKTNGGQFASSSTALADAAAIAPPRPLPHHAHHAKPAAPNGGAQYFAANDTPRQTYASDRITPPAATVMYTPVGSSLGMASAASLAPPRPLYSSSQ